MKSQYPRVQADGTFTWNAPRTAHRVGVDIKFTSGSITQNAVADSVTSDTVAIPKP